MKRVLKHLLNTEAVLDEVASLAYGEFEKSVASLMGLGPDNKDTRSLKSVRERMKKVRSGEDKSNLAQLQQRQAELLRELRTDEDVRVYKKLSEYLMERLTDILLTKGLEDEARRIRLVDAIDRSIKGMFSGSRDVEVTEVMGVSRGMVGTYLSSEQSELKAKVEVPGSEYDGKGPGIILAG